MNDAPPMLSPASPRRHIAVLCGSSAPFSCGVHDYSQRLNEEFAKRGNEVQALQEPVTLAGLPTLHARLRSAKPDVLLMQYPNAAYGYSLAPHLLANALRPIPLVLTLHEFGPAHPLRKLSIGLLARARAIIVTNEWDRVQLVRWFPWVGRRVWTIPLASNIAGRPWRPSEQFTVVYFGLFRSGKGLEEFLECARIVRARCPRVNFRAIGAMKLGDAEYGRKFIEAAAGSGVDVHVGASADEVAEALSSASLAYLPFPDGATERRGSLLAAASCGVPVLSTVGTFTTSDLADAIVHASCPHEAAEYLLRLMDDPQQLHAAHVRSQRIGAAFSWENVAQRYVDLFSSGCAPHPASA